MAGAMRRRLRIGGMSLLFLLSVAASVVLANIVFSRVSTRIDVTAVGEHHLSPRTRAILDRLGGEFEVVLAGPWADISQNPQNYPELNPRVVAQVMDLLRELDLASRSLRVTEIDTLTEAGARAYGELIQRLVARESQIVEDSHREIQSALDAVARVADSVGGIADDLGTIADALPGGSVETDRVKQQIQILAGQLRRMAADMGQRSADGTQRLGALLFGQPIGGIEIARAVADSALTGALPDLDAVSDFLDGLRASPDTPGQTRDALAGLSPRASATRDGAARALDRLERLERADVVRVATALEHTSAALVVGPTDLGLSAIGFDALFPFIGAERQAEGFEADVRGHAEDVLAAALSAMLKPNAPIIVFTHAAGQRGLLTSGAIRALVRRLNLSRVDVLEWATAVEPTPPTTIDLDPAGTRPVVYVIIGTDSSTSAGPSSPLSGAQRVEALARALARLAETDQNVLLCMTPSSAGTWGGDDPAVAELARFGLRALTATPLMRTVTGPQGTVVAATSSLRPTEGHVIAEALGSLPMAFRWAVPVEPVDGFSDQSVTATCLAEVATPDAWAETNWLGAWRNPPAPPAPPMWIGPSAPRPDPGVDDAQGPWPVVWAVERRLDGGAQRWLVVGADAWFSDQQAQQSALVGGVTVRENPGNLALFEAGVSWLAFQDDLIGQGPSARTVSRIRLLSSGEQSAIRWGLLAGLPLGVLLLGVLFRLVRG